MAVSTAAIIGSAAIGAGAGILGSTINNLFGSSASASNRASQERINRQNIDFAREMTQAQWERDDKAYQRQVADLEAAGLSPLAATGAGAANSPAVTAQAFPYTHEFAPQVDVNSMIQNSLSIAKLAELHKENQSKQDYRTSFMALKNQELQFMYDQLAQEGYYTNKKIAQDDEHFIKSFELQSQQFEELKRHNLKEEDVKAFCAKNEAIANSIQKMLPDKRLPTQIIEINSEKDLQYFHIQQQLYQDSYSRYLNEVLSNGRTPKSKADAYNQSMNGSGSVSANDSGFSLSAGTSSGKFHSETKDENQIFDEGFIGWCLHNDIKYPIPVYHSWSK